MLHNKLSAAALEPETVVFEHDCDEIPPLDNPVVLKGGDGLLLRRSIINLAGEFADKVVEHPVLAGAMGSGKTRQTIGFVGATVHDGVNLVHVPRRKLATNQQRSYSAVYGRLVWGGRLPSLIGDGETRSLVEKVTSLDLKCNGAQRANNMDIARREQLLARLGHGYVVYSKQDKHTGYKTVKSIVGRNTGTIIVLPKQCPSIVRLLQGATLNLFITDELKCLTSMVGSILSDEPTLTAIQKLANAAKRLIFLDADFNVGNQPRDFAIFMLMGRERGSERIKDRLVVHKLARVKPHLLRSIALFHKSVPRDIEATWLSKLNERLRVMKRPAVVSCGTGEHFRFLLDSIKVFMKRANGDGKAFKVFATCSSRRRANTEAADAMKAQLRATAFTTNTDAKRGSEEMADIDEFFARMEFVTASSTIDVGIDSLVHFPFIVSITRGGTSMPSAHLQAMYRVSRILPMEFTVLWYVDEPLPQPNRALSQPSGSLAMESISKKAAFHSEAGTGEMPMHPKLVSIYVDNRRETQWNSSEHAVFVRESLRLSPCYSIVEPWEIKMPDGVFAVTPRDVSAMQEAYIDISPNCVAAMFKDARDVALEISDPLERHQYGLAHFKRCVTNRMLGDSSLSAGDAEYLVLSSCDGIVSSMLSDAGLAKLDAGTLESVLLDTWKVIKYTGLSVDAAVVKEMEGRIEQYVLGVASLKGHLAVEHFYMTLQRHTGQRGAAQVTLHCDIASKVKLVERAAHLLRVPQLVPTSPEHVVILPPVIVSRVNRLMQLRGTLMDVLWKNELAECTRGISDSMRIWRDRNTLAMLGVLCSEVGNCKIVTESRPLTPTEQEALKASLLAHEGLDGDAPPPPPALAASPPVAEAQPDFESQFAVFQPSAVTPTAPPGGVGAESRRLQICEEASKSVYLLMIGIKLGEVVYTRDGPVAKGATRVVQENDAGERREVLSAEKEEQRKRRNKQKTERRAVKKAANGSVTQQVDGAREQPVADSSAICNDDDPLQTARDKANTYNASFLGGMGAAEETEEVKLEPVSLALTPEDKARDERRKAARMEALERRNRAAAGEVAEFEGDPEYAAKLAAAKRRLASEFQAPQMVPTFDDDSLAIKTVHPMLLMKWHNTLTCKTESPFATSHLLDERSRQVVAKRILTGYRDEQPSFEPSDEDEERAEDGGGADSPKSGMLPHSLLDGYEVCFELYPLEKLVKLLATAKGCTDETTNVKELFNRMVCLPAKVRTNYATAKVVDALERLLAKGEKDFEGDTLKVQVNYRPGNKLSGVSRSYASHPSNQTMPNAVRVALMGPHLHDLDVAIALPTCAEIGLRMIRKDPCTEWPTGMEYVQDRRNGVASGKDEKLFQQEICEHYNGRLTLDDAKEMINIAMNQGQFEFYLQRDHGVVATTCHSAKLLHIRSQSRHVRKLFLENGDAIIGSKAAFEKLKEDVCTKKEYLRDAALYSCGDHLCDTEKFQRTMFALILHTIERKVMKVCVAVAQRMRLVVYSSIFDGLQLVHPQEEDWIGLLNAYRQECHDRLLEEFGTSVYLVEKPFYISGVANHDVEGASDAASTSSDLSGAATLDPREQAFGMLLRGSYRTA